MHMIIESNKTKQQAEVSHSHKMYNYKQFDSSETL